MKYYNFDLQELLPNAGRYEDVIQKQYDLIQKCILCIVVFNQCLLFVSDMAVAIEDKVEFLDKNATLVGITYQVFKNLKAIAFDDIRHHFIVSDMIEENDTIYRIKLSDTQNPIPIVKNIPDDVMVSLMIYLLYYKHSTINNKQHTNYGDSIILIFDQLIKYL